MRRFLGLSLPLLFLLLLAGCGPSKTEQEKDRLDTDSLKAIKNPPPGAPGAPPAGGGGKTPGAPSGG
jgi:uncharacterized lipoprotein